MDSKTIYVFDKGYNDYNAFRNLQKIKQALLLESKIMQYKNNRAKYIGGEYTFREL